MISIEIRKLIMFAKNQWKSEVEIKGKMNLEICLCAIRKTIKNKLHPKEQQREDVEIKRNGWKNEKKI